MYGSLGENSIFINRVNYVQSRVVNPIISRSEHSQDCAFSIERFRQKHKRLHAVVHDILTFLRYANVEYSFVAPSPEHPLGGI